MKQQPSSLIDRAIRRLVTTPSVLDMEHFSVLTDGGTTFCLAGLILDESAVRMEYHPQLRRAIGLAKGERAPAPEWVRHELSIVSVAHREILAQDVLIPAKAREIWASAYGVTSAKQLPLYPADWNCVAYDRITADLVVRYLRTEKPVKATTAESLRDVA